ncbi:MAG: hypothetical protein IJ424_03320 [Oscillospiraceae bacterium]|nr:hypothetical protein [Oscillospiraceae bacterium]
MKKMLAIILSITIFLVTLASCTYTPKSDSSESEAVTSKDIAVTTSDYITWDEPVSVETTQTNDSSERFADAGNGQFHVLPSDQIKVDNTKLNIAGNYNVFTSSAMQSSVAVTGIESDFVTFFTDEIVVKILAGDSNVDIYLLGSSEIDLLKKRSIYYPLESDVIDNFVDGCFDYLSESVTDDEGKIIALPISIYESFLSYPIAAETELGFTSEDIKYYRDFHGLINSYDGERVSYAMGANLFFNYDSQYENYYCDFDNMVYDYDTDVYRGIYSLLDGWQRYGLSPSMPGFSNPAVLGADGGRLIFDESETLFLTTKKFSDFIFANTADPYVDIEPCNLNNWRAVHIPWISQDVSENYVNATYAFINPYSKHYDEAVKFLEYIAENYFDSISTYTFIRVDKEEYPDTYMKETQMFSDVYDICKNGFVSEYTVSSSRNDIEEYQTGRATLDEAIAMYQREVEIWLNE